MRHKIIAQVTMSTLIKWHNRFSENENEAVKNHIPRHRDSKAKKRDLEIRGLKHHDIEKRRQLSHDNEIPRLKNYDVEIRRPKSHNIEFLWNSDPYAP